MPLTRRVEIVLILDESEAPTHPWTAKVVEKWFRDWFDPDRFEEDIIRIDEIRFPDGMYGDPGSDTETEDDGS